MLLRVFKHGGGFKGTLYEFVRRCREQALTPFNRLGSTLGDALSAASKLLALTQASPQEQSWRLLTSTFSYGTPLEASEPAIEFCPALAEQVTHRPLGDRVDVGAGDDSGQEELGQGEGVAPVRVDFGPSDHK